MGKYRQIIEEYNTPSLLTLKYWRGILRHNFWRGGAGPYFTNVYNKYGHVFSCCIAI